MLVSLIGFVAMFTSAISLLPQIYRTYQTRSAKDLSPAMLWNLWICSISWVLYGLLIEAAAIWMTNILMTLFSSTLLVLSRRYRVRD
ncbi:MAG: SemiSWEET family transporter [Chlamydiota bacterium]